MHVLLKHKERRRVKKINIIDSLSIKVLRAYDYLESLSTIIIILFQFSYYYNIYLSKWWASKKSMLPTKIPWTETGPDQNQHIFAQSYQAKNASTLSKKGTTSSSSSTMCPDRTSMLLPESGHGTFKNSRNSLKHINYSWSV